MHEGLHTEYTVKSHIEVPPPRNPSRNAKARSEASPLFILEKFNLGWLHSQGYRTGKKLRSSGNTALQSLKLLNSYKGHIEAIESVGSCKA